MPFEDVLEYGFQRDVFFLARYFIAMDWPWRIHDNLNRNWRDLDTHALAMDPQLPFESLDLIVPNIDMGEAHGEAFRTTPYAFAEMEDDFWSCPPALTELFGELFADKGERRPDAAEAAARIRTIVER